jgi:predicted lipoprotein with Yx(FWY)xxD motif
MELGHTRSITRPRTAPVLFAAAAFLGTLAALFAAGHSSAASRATQVKVGTTKLGRILVNGQGRTLYMFAADKRGTSTCYGQCASFWPPLVTSTKQVSEAGLKMSMLGTTKRTDGKLQVTYNGHPLYRYDDDKGPGQHHGQGLKEFGAKWYVVKANGNKLGGY